MVDVFGPRQKPDSGPPIEVRKRPVWIIEVRKRPNRRHRFRYRSKSHRAAHCLPKEGTLLRHIGSSIRSKASAEGVRQLRMLDLRLAKKILGRRGPEMSPFTEGALLSYSAFVIASSAQNVTLDTCPDRVRIRMGRTWYR